MYVFAQRLEAGEKGWTMVDTKELTYHARSIIVMEFILYICCGLAEKIVDDIKYTRY